MPVVVNLITGFLGAGKTTALLHQLDLRRGRERVAVLVNDFGEAAIDATLLDGAGVGLSEVRGACVCCTAPEGFTEALGQLLDGWRPDRIFIEPTGLARASDLLDTLRRGPHAPRLELGPTVCLVNPAELGLQGPFPALVREQAEAADVLVASHVDRASEAALARFEALADALWPGPLARVRAERGALDPALFDWPEGEGARRRAQGGPQRLRVLGPAAPAGGHPFVARSLAWGPEVVFDTDRLVAAVGRALAGEAGARMVRLKGLFRTAEGVALLEVAGGEVHERLSAYRRDSRCDLIFEGRDTQPLDTLATWLADAARAEGEGAIDPSILRVVGPLGEVRFGAAELAGLPGQVADVSVLVPKREGRAVRVAEVLAAAGLPLEGLGQVAVGAADGFASPAVPAAALAEAVVVYALGDGPLPAEKGGPFRLLVPGDAGPAGPCSNVKGLVRLSAGPFPSAAPMV
jgi:G3E family GTPase